LTMATQSGKVYIQGFLNKRGGSKQKLMGRTWKKRWFVCSSENLGYYKEAAHYLKGLPLGMFEIRSDLRIEEVKGDDLLFHIISHDREEPMAVKAATKANKLEWMVSLKEAIRDHEVAKASRKAAAGEAEKQKVSGETKVEKVEVSDDEKDADSVTPNEQKGPSIVSLMNATGLVRATVKQSASDGSDVKYDSKTEEKKELISSIRRPMSPLIQAFLAESKEDTDDEGSLSIVRDMKHEVRRVQVQARAGLSQLEDLRKYLDSIVTSYRVFTKSVSEANTSAQNQHMNCDSRLELKDQMSDFEKASRGFVHVMHALNQKNVLFADTIQANVLQPIESFLAEKAAVITYVLEQEIEDAKACVTARLEMIKQRQACMKAFNLLVELYAQIATNKTDKAAKAKFDKQHQKTVTMFNSFEQIKLQALDGRNFYMTETIPNLLRILSRVEKQRLKLLKKVLLVCSTAESKLQVPIKISSVFLTQVQSLDHLASIQVLLKQWSEIYEEEPATHELLSSLPCTAETLKTEEWKQSEVVLTALAGEEDDDDDEGGDEDQASALQSSKGGDSSASMSAFFTNAVRGLVSKKKKRYQLDGFDLDLTYISPKIIAMGFPAEGLTGTYRNPLAEVQKFFTMKHHMRYRIFNLCSEIFYDPIKFEERVARYPFPDHNPSPFAMLNLICEDIHRWLNRHPKNVAAIHCKAGKGRTGYVIAAYLVYAGICTDANEALHMYGKLRTSDGKGVTIMSQIRFVHYYQKWLSWARKLAANPSLISNPSLPGNIQVIPESRPLFLKSVVVHGLPFIYRPFAQDFIFFEIRKPLENVTLCEFESKNKYTAFPVVYNSCAIDPEARNAEDYMLWHADAVGGMCELNHDFRVDFYKSTKPFQTIVKPTKKRWCLQKI